MQTAQLRQLELHSLSLGYGQHTVVKDLSLTIPPGKITAIIGANGCGKSTVLRGIARLLKAQQGSIEVDGRSLSSYPAKKFARMVSLLPQSPVVPDGITVADLVSRGRYPYQGLFLAKSAQDDAVVAWALEMTKTDGLAQQVVSQLSGGQRQRVWLAMVLAQEADIMLLDEPTTYLDLAHQVELLDLLADLNEQYGITIVMVLHELNLTARVAHHLLAMKDGQLAALGDADTVLTEQNLSHIFGLRAAVADPLADGSRVVIPYARGGGRAPGQNNFSAAEQGEGL